MRERVHSFAAGLQSLGLSAGDRVALVAEGRSDWIAAELAVLYSGAINVPISVKIDESADLKFRLAHSGCKMVICSAGQREKISAVRNDLPDFEKVILLDMPSELRQDEEFVGEVISRGVVSLKENPNALEKRRDAIRENDCANICYTSGTTADPKGIMLTH